MESRAYMNITLLAAGALPTTGVDLVKKVVFGQSALSLAVHVTKFDMAKMVSTVKQQHQLLMTAWLTKTATTSPCE
jgi:hypothetical protein